MNDDRHKSSQQRSSGEYWCGIVTITLLSPIALATLLVRPDSSLDSTDVLHWALILGWSGIFLLHCEQYPMSFVTSQKRGKAAAGLVCWGVGFLAWVGTMVFMIWFTFISPYMREKAGYIFCGVLVSSVLVIGASCMFFWPRRQGTDDRQQCAGSGKPEG